MYQLKLKVLWVKNILGLGIDQQIIKQQYPLTIYYFWPRTEAWEQLKSELDSKSWLKKEEKIKILNLASDIMNHWRQYRDVDSVESVKNKFLEASFIDTKS